MDPILEELNISLKANKSLGSLMNNVFPVFSGRLYEFFRDNVPINYGLSLQKSFVDEFIDSLYGKRFGQYIGFFLVVLSSLYHEKSVSFSGISRGTNKLKISALKALLHNNARGLCILAAILDPFSRFFEVLTAPGIASASREARKFSDLVKKLKDGVVEVPVEVPAPLFGDLFVNQLYGLDQAYLWDENVQME